MNRIVLIGNGFDLAHGLKTKYEHFIDWYWDQRVNGFIGNYTNISIDPLCTFEIKDNADFWNVYYYQLPKFATKFSGKDVVQSLINDPSRYNVVFSPFFERIIKSIETKGWVDIENEYYELLTQELRVNSINTVHTTAKELNEQLDFLQKSLIQYLNTIDQTPITENDSIRDKIYSPIDPHDVSIEKKTHLKEYIESCENQDDRHWKEKMGRYGMPYYTDSEIERYKKDHTETYPSKYPQAFMLPDQIMLLSFNYTRTAKLYHKHNFFLNYIHGELDKPESIIFGYGDELDKKYSELRDLNDNEYMRHVKSINYLESESYRRVLEFIESAPFQVCIMGHSCGNSDRTLLNTIFEHKNCISIKPYYYVKEDGTDNYLELVQNISRNFTDMKLMRDRVVNKTYTEPLTSPIG